ncbi:MAG TPA: MBL fold metallo-hydrolase [Streptosporangiaceae bacterium]|nr:MBL fold metallo-hydrolase [Streptosporangiaceae bacterium]
MSYTGDVRVGGPADTREINGLTVTKIAVGPYENNAYLLRDGTGQGLLIDAAAEPERLLEMIGDTPVQRIVTTHRHPDHWQALEQVRAATGATTVAHPADAPGIPVPADELVEDGGTVRFGDTSLSVIHLVGHTPGSIALCYRPDGPEPHLFTGDCLFPGGVGNTQQDPERFTSLYNGVVAKIFGRLPDATWVYPGHGKDTTLGAERPHLAEWRERGW